VVSVPHGAAIPALTSALEAAGYTVEPINDGQLCWCAGEVPSPRL